MSLPLRVLGDRVLIKPDVDEHAVEQTRAGIYLADSLAAAVEGEDTATSYTSGVIVAVGTVAPCLKCGRVKRDLAVGDRVTFSWKSGQEVTIDNDTFVIMNEADVLAVLQETPPV